MMREAFDRADFRHAAQQEQNHAPPTLGHRLRNRERHAAAAADHRERALLGDGGGRVHASSSASRRLIAIVKGRFPARMNSISLAPSASLPNSRGHALHARAEFAGSEKQRFVGLAVALNVGLGKSAPAHADHVEADEMRQRPLRHAPGNDIGANAAQAHDHRALADAHELAYRHAAAEHDIVADGGMTAEQDVVGEHHIVSHLAIMRHMGADHEETMVADFGHAAAVLGAGIHGDIFADIAVGADHEPRRPAAVMRRLRRRAERCERMNDGARTDGCMAGEIDVPDQPAAVADRDMSADGAIGADRYIAADCSPRLDPSRGIDDGSVHVSAIMAPTSASATSWPATLASPLYHHMLRRFAMRFM